MKKVILIFFIVVFLVVIIVGIDFFRKITKSYKGFEKDIKIYVKKGSSVTSIARILSDEKIISNYFYFV